MCQLYFQKNVHQTHHRKNKIKTISAKGFRMRTLKKGGKYALHYCDQTKYLEKVLGGHPMDTCVPL